MTDRPAMTNGELADLLERLDKEATPLKGGWVDLGGVHPSRFGGGQLEARVTRAADHDPVWAWTRLSDDDVNLLIALRNNLPAILLALRQGDGERERVKKEIMRIGNMISHGGMSAMWAHDELLTLFRSLIPKPAGEGT